MSRNPDLPFRRASATSADTQNDARGAASPAGWGAQALPPGPGGVPQALRGPARAAPWPPAADGAPPAPPRAAKEAWPALGWSAAVLVGYAACARTAAAPPWVAVASREGLGLLLVGVPLARGRLRLFGPAGPASLYAAARLGSAVLPAWLLGRSVLAHAWHLAWPPELGATFAATAAAAAHAAWVHVVAVALPEEAFWRGYVQPALQARWPAAQRVAGAPMGGAQVLACGLFAASHVAGGGSWWTLGTFFPGLLFAWTRSRHNSLGGPWALHAACNLVAKAAAALLPALSPHPGPVVPM